jgi:hypothetical protein
MAKVPKAPKARPGRRSLFRGKVREHPVTITFTALHLRKLRSAESRLGVTRADVLGLLVDKHADSVQLPEAAKA